VDGVVLEDDVLAGAGRVDDVRHVAAQAGVGPDGDHGKRRLHRIFGEDGRALIVAMDHGSQGPMPGLEQPGRVLDEVVAGISGVDVILVEGYKWANRPKIEVMRAERSLEPVCAPDELLAIASDVIGPSYDVPHFNLDDAAGLANLIETHFLH